MDELKSIDNNSDSLEHFGVLGMKWGKRKNRDISVGNRAIVLGGKKKRLFSKKNKKNQVVVTDNDLENINSSARNRNKALSGDLDHMTNAQIKSAIARINLEKEYRSALGQNGNPQANQSQNGNQQNFNQQVMNQSPQQTQQQQSYFKSKVLPQAKDAATRMVIDGVADVGKALIKKKLSEAVGLTSKKQS